MKGISAIIATLLMLVITVGLAITAYGYISGVFGKQTQKQIDVSDASCAPGAGLYYVTLRNLDSFNNISTGDISMRVDEAPVTAVWVGPALQNGKPVVTTDNTSLATIACSNAGAANVTNCVAGTAHRVKVINAAGSTKSISIPVSC